MPSPTAAIVQHVFYRPLALWRRGRLVAAHPDLVFWVGGSVIAVLAMLLTGRAEPVAACATFAAIGLVDGRRLTRQCHNARGILAVMPAWSSACENAGLNKRAFMPVPDVKGGYRWGWGDRSPVVTRVTTTDQGVKLTVRPWSWHTPDAYADAQLVRALGGHYGECRRVGPDRFEVVVHRDRPRPPGVVTVRTPKVLGDLRALPVARDTRNSSKVAVLPLLGTHLLVAGATRAGKSSAIWALIQQTAPGIRAGTVRWHVIDPKGGMELGPGAPLFETFVHDDGGRDFGGEVIRFLQERVRDMTGRANTVRQDGRREIGDPTVEHPLEVILVDEVLALRAGLDARRGKEFDALLKRLLTMGAAVGYSVIVASQDVSKEAGLDRLRDLIPTRVCLRVNDHVQVDMTLGQGARARGAEADRIDFKSERGVAYVASVDSAWFARVRFNYVSDELIAGIVRGYLPPRPEPEVVPDSVPEPEPVVEPVLEGEVVFDSWEGGTPRTRDEAKRLLTMLDERGHGTPSGAKLGAWAGRTDSWGRSVIREWRADCALHAEGDRPEEIAGGDSTPERDAFRGDVPVGVSTQGDVVPA